LQHSSPSGAFAQLQICMVSSETILWLRVQMTLIDHFPGIFVVWMWTCFWTNSSVTEWSLKEHVVFVLFFFTRNMLLEICSVDTLCRWFLRNWIAGKRIYKFSATFFCSNSYIVFTVKRKTSSLHCTWYLRTTTIYVTVEIIRVTLYCVFADHKKVTFAALSVWTGTVWWLPNALVETSREEYYVAW
jgi:hypothetical protein